MLPIKIRQKISRILKDYLSSKAVENLVENKRLLLKGLNPLYEV